MKVAILLGTIIASFIYNASTQVSANDQHSCAETDSSLDIKLHAADSSLYLAERQITLGGFDFGVDYTSLQSTTIVSCLKSLNYKLFIPRGFTSEGLIDPNFVENVRNARKVGISFVDTIFYPCPTCGGAEIQWKKFTEHTVNNGVEVDMVWLAIDNPQDWFSHATLNQKFFDALILAVVKSGWRIGIYSSRVRWEAVFGTMFTKGGQYPLWYSGRNASITFGDFIPFGGFRFPRMKQYSKASDVQCDVMVNTNFY